VSGIVCIKHRPKERETRWVEVERTPRIFQGGEEEVENEKDKNTTTTKHQRKYPNNHCKNCNIYFHTKEKCWKLHP